MWRPWLFLRKVLCDSRSRSRGRTPVELEGVSCGAKASGGGRSLPELGSSDTWKWPCHSKASSDGRLTPGLDDSGSGTWSFVAATSGHDRCGSSLLGSRSGQRVRHIAVAGISIFTASTRGRSATGNCTLLERGTVLSTKLVRAFDPIHKNNTN